MMSYIKGNVNSIFIRVQKYITNPIVNVAPLPVWPREPVDRLDFHTRSARRPRRETGIRQQAISTRALGRVSSTSRSRWRSSVASTPVAVAAIVLKPLLDQPGKLVELRTAHRRCASVAWRHRKLKHLPHALA